MKNILKKMAALLVIFAAATLMGCAGHEMNTTMDSSGDSSMGTMSEQKTDAEMKAMPGDEMQNMQNNDMEKTMDKTMK